MGQKVNPHGLRVGVIKDWDSRWYAREDKVGDLIVEDYKIREFLKKTLYSAGVPTIEIERDSANLRIRLREDKWQGAGGKGQEICFVCQCFLIAKGILLTLAPCSLPPGF